MSSKIEVDTGKLEAIAEWCTSRGWDGVARSLRDILAAPVVERQPVAVIQVAARMDTTKEAWFDVAKETFDEYVGRGDPWIGRTLYTAPPELAELQATIAQLTAENEALSDECGINDKEIEGLQSALADAESKIERLSTEALPERHEAWMAGAEAGRSEIERLKGGQGEPVAWQFYQDGNWWNGDDRIKDHRLNTERAGYKVRDVFASQPAPVSVALDPYPIAEAVRTALDRKACPNVWMVIAYEAVVDKVKELNQ